MSIGDFRRFTVDDDTGIVRAVNTDNVMWDFDNLLVPRTYFIIVRGTDNPTGVPQLVVSYGG